MNKSPPSYICYWRFEDGQYRAYLSDESAVGYGASVKEAVDDLYLLMIENGLGPELSMDVRSEDGSEEKYYVLGTNCAVRVNGKASDLFYDARCHKCGKQKSRNYQVALDVVAEPTSPICMVEPRGIQIYSSSIVDELVKNNVTLSIHGVTQAGEITDYYEIEPDLVIALTVPRRAKIIEGPTWCCSECGYRTVMMQDKVTGVGGIEYLLSNEVKNVGPAFFITKGGIDKKLVLRSWLLDKWKGEGLLDGVPTREVVLIAEQEVDAEFEFPDFPN